MFGPERNRTARRTNARTSPPPGAGGAVPRPRRSSLRRALSIALAVLAPTAFGAAALGAVYYAAGEAAAYLDKSSGFRVERVEVVGCRRLGERDVLALAGLAPGSSIFDVDIREARRRLLLDPRIQRAEVEKRMPATVVVRIAERVPAAVLAGDGMLQLLAEDGTVIGPTTVAAAPDLPVLTGFDLGRLRTDPVGLREELTAAVELLRLLDEAGLPGGRTPAELHRSVRGGFDLLAGDGLVVHLGPGPYRPKLKRLAESVAALDARGLRAAEIFLPGTRHPDRVSVRLGP